nr:lipid IV(A) 4-amino-4-deoxy-L-arabinosyltransferase [uncultured Pseudomonas sp.]
MSQIRSWSLVLLAFALFYVIPLTNHGLWIPDETRYAQISQAMLLDGDWISPRFLGMRYFEKPIAGYWMIALGQEIFGQNLFGVRIASLLATALSTLLVYLLAQKVWCNRHTSIVCALLYGSYGLIAGQSGYANLDPQFTLWVNLSVFALWSALSSGTRAARLGYWALVGVACAMGFLTKGFLGWLIPVLVALPFAAARNRWKDLLVYGPLAIVVAVAVSLPWVTAVHAQEPDYWRFFFWHEHIRRFAGEDAQHARPWWFYLPLLAAACLPWAGMLGSSVRQTWENRRQPAIMFMALWFLMPLFFFSVCRGKLPTYIMPCLMPLALLMGHALALRLRHASSAGLRTNAMINMVIAIGGAASMIYLQLYKPVYHDEPLRLTLVWAVISVWGVAAVAAWLRPLKYWYAPLFGIWMLVAFLPPAMPAHVVNNKTPDQFVARHMPELANVRNLLSNDLGAASALAWRLKTAQVTLYDTQGELKYGLSYPEHRHRSVPATQIQPWLKQARQEGPVGVLLRIDDERERYELEKIAVGGKRFSSGRLTLIILDQSAP